MDDDATLRRVLSRDLVARFDVVVADTTAVAIGLLSSEEFDVVVTDFDLGNGETGIDVLRHARRIDVRIGRVVVTGSIIGHGMDHALAAGDVERVVGKPWTQDALLRAVCAVAWRRQYVAGRRAELWQVTS